MNPPSPRIGTLIKFVEKDCYVCDFRAGKLRLGQVSSYRTRYEQEAGKRHDKAEFADIYSEMASVKVFLGGTNIYIGEGSGSIQARRNLDSQAYVFCMTAVTDAHLENGQMHHVPRGDLISLGDYAIIVTDHREFVRRVHAEIVCNAFLQTHPDLNGEYCGLVEYVDFKKHRGYLGPLRKSIEFSFQDEWRIILIDSRNDTATRDHLWLKIGDLTDITTCVETAYLLRMGFRGVPQK